MPGRKRWHSSAGTSRRNMRIGIPARAGSRITGAAPSRTGRPAGDRVNARRQAIRRAILLVATILVSEACLNGAVADDQIDMMLRRGQIPREMIREHGYSDFTDPLGQFLDLLAAGALVEAKTIQPEACATWLTTRQASPLTGKFRVWNTEIDLDALCRDQ